MSKPKAATSRSGSSRKSTLSRGLRRGSVNVGALTRMAASSVLDGFRQLPAWGRRETAASLVSLFPEAFQGVVVDTTRVSTPIPKEPRKKAAVSRNTKLTEALEATVSSRTSVPEGSYSGEAHQATPSRKSGATGLFDPVLEGLDFQERLAGQNSVERNSNKADNKLLSASLAAAGRGRKLGVTEEVIQETIAGTKESLTAYSALWPSLMTRKKAALKQASKLLSSKPEVRCVETNYVLTTTLVGEASWCVDTEVGDSMDTGQTAAVRLRSESGLQRAKISSIPFHRNRGVPLDITADSVKAFLTQEKGNYSSFSHYLYMSVKTGRVILFWLTALQAGVRWGDDDSVLSVVPAQSPKTKKRKRSTTSEGSTSEA